MVLMWTSLQVLPVVMGICNRMSFLLLCRTLFGSTLRSVIQQDYHAMIPSIVLCWGVTQGNTSISKRWPSLSDFLPTFSHGCPLFFNLTLFFSAHLIRGKHNIPSSNMTKLSYNCITNGRSGLELNSSMHLCTNQHETVNIQRASPGLATMCFPFIAGLYTGY